ncbi:hypothetical protein EFN18_07750 [Propionibacterium freudenreichii]|nr:hypothetical protein [Propionibacterium freudenreichii]
MSPPPPRPSTDGSTPPCASLQTGGTPSLRATALGFQNLTHYIARNLLKAGGFRPTYTLVREEPSIEVWLRVQVHRYRES